MLLKKLGFLLISLFSAGSFAWTFNDKPSESLAIGASIVGADVPMIGADSITYSLDSLKKKNGLLVIFSCNSCPFVVGHNKSESSRSDGWEGRYNYYHELCQANDIGMVLINSNEAKREKDDSWEAMKARSLEKGYTMPYVVDSNSKLANLFGAKTTPHVFLFNQASKLAYKGSIDDNVSSAEEVKFHYLKDAIMDVADGKEVQRAETKPLGCSIKRKG